MLFPEEALWEGDSLHSRRTAVAKLCAAGSAHGCAEEGLVSAFLGLPCCVVVVVVLRGLYTQRVAPRGA